MRVAQLGDGEPDVAVVGGIHGDEPCGVRAVEALLADPPAVERPVKLVVANETAIERGVRYVDADLNRSFPGDAGGGYEARLAEDLAAEVAGCTVLSMHSTQSHPEPFAIVDGVDDLAGRICPRLSVEAVVDSAPFVDGRLFAAAADVVEVECGLQRTEAAADNATRLAREFLAAVGALPGATRARSLPAFRLERAIEKPPGTSYEVFVENFEHVDAGEPFAAADGEVFRAESPFYPVLLSATGYERIFGYAAGTVGEVTAE